MSCFLTPGSGAGWLLSDSGDPVDQAPLSPGFSRQEHGRGLPFPSPGDPPDSGIKPTSPALAGRFFTAEPPGKLNADLDAVK